MTVGEIIEKFKNLPSETELMVLVNGEERGIRIADFGSNWGRPLEAWIELEETDTPIPYEY